MNAKLTLSLDKNAIETGKRFAAATGKSLSAMVEDFFVLLGTTPQETSCYPISPSLQQLVGIGSGPFDEKDFKAHIIEKQGSR